MGPDAVLSGERCQVLAVVGPTAAGKSAVGVELALALSGEVVNADSMQLYRGMDIGTAKLPADARRGVPHHALDVLDVTEEASVAAYQRLARDLVEEIAARGSLPIFVGGSGLYVRAALDDLEFPGTDPTVRLRLEDELAAVGSGRLHERLRDLDADAADAILPSNERRVVRALEVIELTGRAFSARPGMAEYSSAFDARIVGISPNVPLLDERIITRVDEMWRLGFVDEVRTLASRGLRSSRTASRALGYRQLLAHLAGGCTEDEARVATVQSTRRFARRQLSWFRRDPRVEWFESADAVVVALATG